MQPLHKSLFDLPRETRHGKRAVLRASECRNNLGGLLMIVNKHGIPVINDCVSRWQRKRFCDKDLYPSEEAARITARMRPLPLRAYFCRRCQSWHLTKRDVQ
jgi:hypothetical protein